MNQNRYRVRVGESILRDFGEIAEAGREANENRGERKEFLAFRYQQKPESVAGHLPSNMNLSHEDTVTKATVIWPSDQSREDGWQDEIRCRGEVEPAGEYDCVMIWDAKKKEYVLERLHHVSLRPPFSFSFTVLMMVNSVNELY